MRAVHGSCPMARDAPPKNVLVKKNAQSKNNVQNKKNAQNKMHVRNETNAQQKKLEVKKWHEQSSLRERDEKTKKKLFVKVTRRCPR